MRYLHIMRSAPDELVRRFMAAMNESGVVVPLDIGVVDYDQLVADIFRFEKVICWW